MKARGSRSLPLAGAVGVMVAIWVGGLAAPRLWAQGREKHWAIPVVMEKATVRGKVVVLETRKEDRKTLQGLPIEIWTTEPDRPSVKKTMIHSTQTDEGGLFSLPLIEEGQYILVVGQLRLNMTVVPPEPQRRDLDEPKILLILLPKDVV